MKKNIFVAGDSYCFYREDPDVHWPAYLARKLGLELQGQGYPGQGWWPLRKLLLKYQLSEEFNNTDLFVFCHTEHSRYLTDRPVNWNEFETIKKVYFTYLQSDAVSDWCVENWYRELNDLMVNKKVIHLPCFKHSQFDILHGKKIEEPLFHFSVEKAGGTLTAPNFGGQSVLDNMNRYHNHLSPQANIELAERILAVIVNDQVDADRFEQLYGRQVCL